MPSHSLDTTQGTESSPSGPSLPDKALASRANALAGYAFVGAWLGGIAGLLGIHFWIGPAYGSMITGLIGGLVGLLRLRRTAP